VANRPWTPSWLFNVSYASKQAAEVYDPSPPPGPTNGRTPQPHYVNFFAQDASVDLTVLMGDGPAELTGGDGGWQTEDRQGLTPVTWWQTPSPYQLSVPVLFDGNSQEADINKLRSLARSPGNRVPPPVVYVAGQAIERADIPWVVQTIAPTSQVVRRASDGNRVRAGFTVTLLQYVAAEVLVEKSAAKRAAGKGKSKSGGRKTYKVAAGDTLPQIAARKDIYRDATRWKDIANANKIRDPRALTVGRTLKIPRP
jgi:LysM repeat protein